MTTSRDDSARRRADALARRVYLVALGFFGLVAVLGALLRWSQVRSIEGFAYGNWLHAHSHAAFLGYVFNAFLALALARFAPASERTAFRRLFGVMLVAVFGMLATFPVQGYAPASIAFSTLHMAAASVFAWRLWKKNTAGPAARGHLRVALAALVLSGLGPLVLGPLAALGLRDTPAYPLSIYFYLHAQYNGWFLFFLQALLLQPAEDGTKVSDQSIRLSRLACRWLGAGLVLTLAQSTLWLGPPAWVRGVAALGGAAQLAGFVFFLRALSAAPTAEPPAGVTLARGLWRLALGAWGLKIVLQAAAAAPGLAGLVNHRFVVIAFLHLVFLGVVTPAILASGLGAGWLRDTGAARIALGVFFAAAAVSEGALVLVALGWTPPVSLPWLLFAPTAAMALALLALLATQRGKRATSRGACPSSC